MKNWGDHAATDPHVERTEWTLLRGPAAPNRARLEPSADLLSRPVRESSRPTATAGSGRSSLTDQARNSPLSSVAPASAPTKRVWRAGNRQHTGPRNDSSMAIRHPEAPAKSWIGFSPQDDRDESGRYVGHHRLPFLTEGSPRPRKIFLALPAMRTSVPTPTADD